MPTISKLFEKHIANQLHIYLETTGLLQKTQSGFRKHHSCQTALINIVDSWLKCIDDGNLIGSVFIDFKKAFDLVDHEILLYKLKLYHFDDQACALFSSYLQNRTQIVKAENTVSENMNIISGVPQGSMALCYFLFMSMMCLCISRVTQNCMPMILPFTNLLNVFQLFEKTYKQTCLKYNHGVTLTT